MGQAALGQLGEALGADRADRDEGVRIPPLMIEHGSARVAVLEPAQRVPQVTGQLPLTHPGVSTQRHQHHQPGDSAMQRRVHRTEQQRHRAAAGAVGHQHANPSPIQIHRGELLVHERPHLIVGQRAVPATHLGRHVSRKRTRHTGLQRRR